MVVVLDRVPYVSAVLYLAPYWQFKKHVHQLPHPYRAAWLDKCAAPSLNHYRVSLLQSSRTKFTLLPGSQRQGKEAASHDLHGTSIAL